MQLRRFTLRLIVSVEFLLSTFICPFPVRAQLGAGRGLTKFVPIWSKAGISFKGLKQSGMSISPISFKGLKQSGISTSLYRYTYKSPRILEGASFKNPSFTPLIFNEPSFSFPRDQFLEPLMEESYIKQDIEPRDYIAVLEALCSIPYKSICGTWRIMKLQDDPMNAKILLISESPILTNNISEYEQNSNNEYIVIFPDGIIVNQTKDILLFYEYKLPEVPLYNKKAKNVNWLSETMIAIDVNKDLLDFGDSYHGTNDHDFQPQFSRPEGADVTPTFNFDNADEKVDLEEYQPLPSEKESIKVIMREYEKGGPSIRDYQDGNETKDVFRLKISPSEGIGTGFVKIENSRYDTEFQRAA